METFSTALENYISNVQEIHNLDFATNYPRNDVPVISFTLGKKYARVVKNGSSVHSFVNMTNGDILKPASWNSPAKHTRGSIYIDQGSTALDSKGFVRYL